MQDPHRSRFTPHRSRASAPIRSRELLGTHHVGNDGRRIFCAASGSIPADQPAAYLQIPRSRGSIRREIATKVTPTSSACERDDDVGGTAGHWSRPYAIAGGHLRSTNIGAGLDVGDAKK